jgi:hypothetical protein
MLNKGNGARDRNTGIEPDQQVSTRKPLSAAPYKSITSRATRKPFETPAPWTPDQWLGYGKVD